MNDTQILEPMLGMMVLTAVVWFVLYARRIPAMRKVGVPTQEYTTPDKGAALLPEAVSYPSNNFKNLFELPVLFYGLCLYLFVTQSAATADIVAAWLFFGFRVLHPVPTGARDPCRVALLFEESAKAEDLQAKFGVAG